MTACCLVNCINDAIIDVGVELVAKILFNQILKQQTNHAYCVFECLSTLPFMLQYRMCNITLVWMDRDWILIIGPDFDLSKMYTIQQCAMHSSLLVAVEHTTIGKWMGSSCSAKLSEDSRDGEESKLPK